MAESKCYIVIHKGEPYDEGSELILTPGKMLVGRPWKSHQPDIPFFSPHVSKQHAELTLKNGIITLTDLSSKHGTRINGTDIVPQKQYALKNRDQISLAKGVVVFNLFSFGESEVENTVDFFNRGADGPDISASWPKRMVVDPLKREIFIEGKPVNFYGKEIELLLVLYDNANQATSLEEIKRRVWPERVMTADGSVPDVGTDEINSLVYRLRKRLKDHSDCIVTIPRFGYRLDIDI